MRKCNQARHALLSLREPTSGNLRDAKDPVLTIVTKIALLATAIVIVGTPFARTLSILLLVKLLAYELSPRQAVS